LSLLERSLAVALPVVPRPIVARLAAPYIAGETLEDALAVVSRLADDGQGATIDVLGEAVETMQDAERLRLAYTDVLGAVADRNLRANISIKPTGFGLLADRRRAFELIRALVDEAALRGNFVRLDMEDSSTTDAILDVYRRLRAEGRTNVGIVLQAALRRSPADVRSLAQLVPRVRVCKGIYLESPELAHVEPPATNDAYVAIVDALLNAGSHVALATHDERLVARLVERIERRRIDVARYEFQMLLGVKEGLASDLVAAGHTVRIYVPFGRQWYEYSLRRLRENPRIAGHVARATFRRRLTAADGHPAVGVRHA
jgi:proline dehydrogenase